MKTLIALIFLSLIAQSASASSGGRCYPKQCGKPVSENPSK